MAREADRAPEAKDGRRRVEGLPPFEDVLAWDVRTWSQAVPFWLARSRLQLGRCDALELGANRGGLSLMLAIQGARVTCSDYRNPEPQARPLHERYGLHQRIEYRAADATALPFADQAFDLVVYKSVLGAMRTLENQRKMCLEIARVLRPGGELWFAENLVGSPLHRLARRTLVSWGRSWRYVTAAEVRELVAPIGTLEEQAFGVLAAFGRREWQRSLLGMLDQGLDALVPANWKYILFGIVRKPPRLDGEACP